MIRFKTMLLLLITLYLSFLYSGVAQSPETHNHNLREIGEFGFPNNPLEDRAKGFVSLGKAKTTVTNYGNDINWNNSPGGLWGNYNYITAFGFLAGVKGHEYSSNYQWQESDMLTYYNEWFMDYGQDLVVWCSEDLYNDWDLDTEELSYQDLDAQEDGVSLTPRPNGEYIGMVFDTHDDRGSVGTRKEDIDSFDGENQWAFDFYNLESEGESNSRVCITVPTSVTLNPNYSNAMIGAIYPWGLRPSLNQRLDQYDLYNYGPDEIEYTNDDEYDYYGSTVSESWFTRWENASNADWQGTTGSYGGTHGSDIDIGDLFGNTIFFSPNDNTPSLAHSIYPQTFPDEFNDDLGSWDSFWPGWYSVSFNEDLCGENNFDWCWEEVPGEFISDSDIFMQYDDRWAQRGNMIDESGGEYLQTGYPMGLQVSTQIYSYGVAPLEDIIVFDSKLSNQSHELVMPDGTKLVSGDGFNYKNLSIGFLFDADVLTTDMYNNINYHTNDDDYMEYIDCKTSDQFYPDGCPIFDNEELRVSIAVIGDWDGQSGAASGYSMDPQEPSPGNDFGLVAVQLLDTPVATDNIDLDQDGNIDIYAGEELKMTDWHWFDWYNRPGVVHREGSGGCCAGDPDKDQALNKEEIMYKIMAGDTTNLSEDEKEWFFHANPSLDQLDPDFNPHFDNVEDLISTEFFQNGPNGLDAMMILSAGPFSLDIGESTNISYAVIFGSDHEDLLLNAEMNQMLYNNHFRWFSAPDAPIVSLEEDSHSIKIEWSSNSENSTDQLSDELDFEGYRVYRSLDGGMTWGDESDMIYDNNGIHVGWIPYAQFDYSLEEDLELYGQDVSGSDPINPWFSLGNNTGIQNNFEDYNVVPYQEYCYAVTAYDVGFLNSMPNFGESTPGSLESSRLDVVCGSPIGEDFDGAIMSQSTNIGWFNAEYILNDSTFLNKSYHLEVEADEDQDSWLNSYVENPTLYAFEVDLNGNPIEVSSYDVANYNFSEFDSLLNLPGAYLSGDIIYNPTYLSVENLDTWFDLDGLFLNISGLTDQYYYNFPNGMPPQDIIWEDEVIENNGEPLEFSMLYVNTSSAIENKPYFDYEITFGEAGIDTAHQVTPSSSCNDLSENTLLPFRIINLTTGNKVNIIHKDKGYNGLGSPSNQIEGYGNCIWDRREPLLFIEEGVNLDAPESTEYTYDLRIDWTVQGNEEYYLPWQEDASSGLIANIITPKFLHDEDSWIFNYNNDDDLSNEDFTIPKDFVLNNPYPNPFNPSTQIDYEIPYLSNVEFILFDINGRAIENFNAGMHIPGYYSFKLDGSDYASGIYFFSMQIDDKISTTKKITLIK